MKSFLKSTPPFECIMKDKDSIGDELEKLGYWGTMYSTNNVFGTGPTKLALIAHEVMMKNNVKNILELGCGQGRDSIFFAENGYNVLATDFSQNAITSVENSINVRKINNVRTKLLDLQKDFGIHEKFDCVYSNLAFQFFDELELSQAFRRISLCLNKGNLLIFSTKKAGDKYHNFGEKVNDNAFKSKGITRYFFEKNVIETLVTDLFDIEDFGDETHTNLDETKSVWWYCIARLR